MVEADKAMSKAKITLMASDETVFYVTVMLSLEHIWDDTMPTAYTDGRVCGYNPEFFMNYCNADERVGLVLHETPAYPCLSVKRFEIVPTGSDEVFRYAHVIASNFARLSSISSINLSMCPVIISMTFCSRSTRTWNNGSPG